MNLVDITPVAVALISLLAAALCVVTVPWVRTKWTAEEIKEFLGWVEIGVAAAEQLYATTEGEKKKAHVIDFVTAHLKDRGFALNAQYIENAIEAAVLKLHKEMYYG